MAKSPKPVGCVPTEDEIKTSLDKTKWGKTYLTEFLHSAETNVKITYVKLRGYFEMLENLADIFKTGSDSVGYSDIGSFVVASLFGRAWGNYFAAVRLSSSGQLPESYVQLRACIENALYAFNIHNDPKLGQVWFNRHKDDKSRKNSIKLFSPKIILDNLEQVYKKLGQETAKDYERCIDYGAHPNERSVSANLNLSGGKISLRLLNTEKGIFQASLLACVMCGLDAIRIFQLIYPDDFKKFNAEQRIQNIQAQFCRIAPGNIYVPRSTP